MLKTHDASFGHVFLLASALVALLWSGISPAGRFNWFMETCPAMAGAIVLLLTYRRFRLTSLTYTLIWIFSLILMVGGHYTYANVPIGNWARDTFHLGRNHYDRLGHVFQGIVPAMIAREVLLRTTTLGRGKMLAAICISFALAISASYELFEWRYAVTVGGQRADDFLGSQGDPWDTQEDMFMALCGAIASQLLLTRWQNRQLREEIFHRGGAEVAMKYAVP
jgi:putative membrane protein